MKYFLDSETESNRENMIELILFLRGKKINCTCISDFLSIDF